MIINQLRIENFGLFKGVNVFDLEPSKNRPIILFGGKNGSGKTTLFEAIKLCLYGNNFRGGRLFFSEYEEYLKDRLHKNSTSESTMSIRIDFTYSNLGQMDNYSVTRSWIFSKDSISENLDVLKNEILLNDIEKDQWQSFVAELIPHGISKLFFFDGEKIQNLANESESTYLIDSFNSLLGLDAIERLKSDLRIYVSRETKSSPDFKLNGDIEKLEKEKKELEEKLEDLHQLHASTQMNIDRLTARIEKQEQKIASEGGGFASKLDKIKNSITKLDEEIKITEKDIRELADDLLPFSIVPEFCEKVKRRIHSEAEIQYENSIKINVKKNYNSFVKKISQSDFWNETDINNDSKKAKIVQRVLDTLISLNSKNEQEIIHYLSTLEQSKMLEWIDLSLDRVPTKLVELSVRLESLTRNRQDQESMLRRVPSDETIAPLIKELNEIHNELGQLQAKKTHYDEEVSKTKFKITEKNRVIQSIVLELTKNKHLSRRLDYANKVQFILEEYSNRLRQDKIDEFSDILLECFNSLYRKKRFINKNKIDPKTFSINLFDRDSNQIQKDMLSAGEKQIYAIAILWALAKTSERHLPFIIDTPLGRLDSEHRGNLVDNFFHKAGKQVIIFSTDTEIDRKYFETLIPHISKMYQLNYDQENKVTKMSKDYFWKSAKVISNDV
jgi:DNA sulfur modification protein DndD